MEFLDPVAKKKKSRRLFLGYGLVTILIALATYIMVATAVGYEVLDLRGNAVQNGLIFINSKPVSASITIDGKPEDDKTDAKLALKAGEYTITLNESGYSSWTKKVVVEGGRVRFIYYPWLFPTNLSAKKQIDLPENVGFTTQSPDKKWLIIQQNANIPAIEVVDLTKPKLSAGSVVFPAGILTDEDGDFGVFEVISWADDNRHFLLRQKLPSGDHKFLLIDRENIDLSVSLNNAFEVDPTDAYFFNGKYDKFYMYFSTGGLVRVANLTTDSIGEPRLDQVLDFESRGEDLILYATTKDANPGKVAVKIYDDGNSYDLSELNFDSSNNYFLEFDIFEGSWYYAIGSGSSELVEIYRNPLNFISAKNPKPASILTTLKAGIPTDISFSPTNNRLIMVRSGRSVAVYDAEEDKDYKYKFPFAIDDGSRILWVDDFHLQAVSGGKVYVVEFDGQNSRQLGDVRNATPAYFSKDYKKLFSITPGDSASSLDLTSLVVKKD